MDEKIVDAFAIHVDDLEPVVLIVEDFTSFGKMPKLEQRKSGDGVKVAFDGC